jgi:hypothetical protein
MASKESEMKKMVVNDDGTVVLEKETASRIKLEKNSKGYNWEVSLDWDRHQEGAQDEALRELEIINNKLTIKYGGPSNG